MGGEVGQKAGASPPSLTCVANHSSSTHPPDVALFSEYFEVCKQQHRTEQTVAKYEKAHSTTAVFRARV